MKKRKILSALITSLIITSVLTSCGGSEEKSEAPSEVVSEITSEAVSEEVSKEEVFSPYAEDKSGYLSNTQTENLNFNSVTIKAKDFKGTFTKAIIDSNGRLTMDVATDEFFASFESDEIEVGKFDTMLISWNAVAGNGKTTTFVSFECADGTWSPYFSFGTWSDKDGVSTSKSTSNEFGDMNVDTLVTSKETTGKIKVKITFNKSGIYVPVVENITIATSTMKEASSLTYPESHINEVPLRSQLAPENGADGGVMCSSTTVAMGLEHMGTKQTTFDTAMGTYDKEFGGYGNWLFSVAEAASHGYYTFCDFYSPEQMKYALSKGYVIGCSTNLTPSGHLVLVVGYETIDGVDYYVVNDPSVEPSKVEVSRYTCEYFDSVWLKEEFNNKGVVYVFQGKY